MLKLFSAWLHVYNLSDQQVSHRHCRGPIADPSGANGLLPCKPFGQHQDYALHGSPRRQGLAGRVLGSKLRVACQHEDGTPYHQTAPGRLESGTQSGTVSRGCATKGACLQQDGDLAMGVLDAPLGFEGAHIPGQIIQLRNLLLPNLQIACVPASSPLLLELELRLKMTTLALFILGRQCGATSLT